MTSAVSAGLMLGVVVWDGTHVPSIKLSYRLVMVLERPKLSVL
jgi:hypothetical protein